jgi:hypothetical protein
MNQDQILKSNSAMRTTTNSVIYVSSAQDYSWNTDRSSAIGWDIAKIGFAGAVLLAPTVPIIVTSVAVVAVVQGGLKLVLDLSLPNKDQKVVDENWSIVDPGGRAAAFASSLLGNNAESIAKHAKYGALAFSVAGTAADISKAKSLESSNFQSAAELYDAYQNWERKGRPSADEWGSAEDKSEEMESNFGDGFDNRYDGIPVNETHFSLSDLIGETNDPSINGESYDLEDGYENDDYIDDDSSYYEDE